MTTTIEPTAKEMVMPKRFSYSAASRYKRCPAAWKFHYIDRLPDDPSIDSVLGSFVHELLEAMYQKVPGRRNVEEMRRDAAKIWVGNKYPEKLQKIGNQDEIVAKKRAWKLATGIWTLEQPEDVVVRGTETRYDLVVNSVPLLVVIDRMEYDEYGAVVITDYKTGKIPNDRYPNQHIGQVALYAAVAHDLGERVSAISLIYLKGKSVVVPFSQSMGERALDEIRSTWLHLSRSIAEDDFEAKPSPLCAWCPFVAHCPTGTKDVEQRFANGKVRADAPGLKLLGLSTEGLSTRNNVT